MPVKVSCPDCAASLKAPDKARGKALKCPKCGGRIKVPAADGPAAAPTRRKAKPKAAGGGGATGANLLANLDLSRAEDTRSEICPKCGTEVAEEDVECPKCGADLLTGGAGASQRRKAKFAHRGEDPAVFYSTAAGDAWAFMKQNNRTALRLAGLTVFGSLLAYGCWVMVAYVAFLPPKMFWGLFAVVGTLIVPGAVWVLQEATIDATMQGKSNLKRFRFDTLLCASRAPRLIVWSAVCLWPLTLVCVAVGLGAWLLEMPAWLVAVPIALQCFATALCWPAGLAHSVMPVSGPAWSLKTVLGGTFANLGPVLYWLVLTFAAMLPTLLVLGGAAAFAWSGMAELFDGMAVNNARYMAAVAEEKPLAEEDRVGLNWMSLLPVAVALLPASFLFAYGVLYAVRPPGLIAKLFRPSLGLVTVAKEKKYVSKLKRDEFGEIIEEDAGVGGWNGVLISVGMSVALGFAGGMIMATLGEGGYLAGIGFGILIAAGIAANVAQIQVLILAFQESVGWGLAALLVPLALPIFGFTHWDRAKYPMISMMLLSGVAMLGFGLMIAGGLMALETPPVEPAA